MIDNGYSLIEITDGAPVTEVARVSLGQWVTLPNGGKCSFDKVGLTTDTSAPRVFKVVARKIDGVAPSNLHTLDQTSVAYTAGEIVETRTFKLLPNAKIAAMAKAKARELILDQLTEKTGGGAFETYRSAVRTRYSELKAAFIAGSTIDIEAGTINGVGGWPT